MLALDAYLATLRRRLQGQERAVGRGYQNQPPRGRPLGDGVNFEEAARNVSRWARNDYEDRAQTQFEQRLDKSLAGEMRGFCVNGSMAESLGD